MNTRVGTTVDNNSAVSNISEISLHSSLVSGSGVGPQVRPPPEHGGDEEEEVNAVGGDADDADAVDNVHEQVAQVHGTEVGQHGEENLERRENTC